MIIKTIADLEGTIAELRVIELIYSLETSIRLL